MKYFVIDRPAFELVRTHTHVWHTWKKPNLGLASTKCLFLLLRAAAGHISLCAACKSQHVEMWFRAIFHSNHHYRRRWLQNGPNFYDCSDSLNAPAQYTLIGLTYRKVACLAHRNYGRDRFKMARNWARNFSRSNYFPGLNHHWILFLILDQKSKNKN